MKHKISLLLLLTLLFAVACQDKNASTTSETEASSGEVSTENDEVVEEKPSTKLFEDIGYEELGQELEIPIQDLGVKFSGEINYTKTIDGGMIKNGSFEMTGDNLATLEPGSGAEMEKTYKYTGSFVNGAPDGLFTRTLMASDYGEEVQVYYEAGACTWSAMDWGGEGEESTYREEQPEDCSFEYIQQKGLQSI